VKAFVVDVNVAIVANGRSSQANDDCRLACIAVLETVCRDGMIVLDDGMRILSQYMGQLSMAGQPGLGDFFMKWVWENQAVPCRCERVAIECKGDNPDDFDAFPEDPDLRGFHRKDRMYVAVAITSRNDPDVLNAVDTGWWHHRDALLRNGVHLRFVCPQHMR
jgi:hypothetical protein